MARCGKDTFAKFLNEIVPTLKYSSIDKVKDIAKLCGWDGKKTEKDRKFLSDLKMLTTEYSNMPFKSIEEKVSEFLKDDLHQILLIDIREPKEIDKVKKFFNAKTLLIKNDNVKQVNSNFGDANVFNYTYDYTIENNGTLEEFKSTVENFAKNIYKII
jgi:dephospho-CoA kinase